MGTSPSISGSDFDEDIVALESSTDIADPDLLVALLQKYPQATATQVKRLWEVAVAQSALAEVQVANADKSLQTRHRLEVWTASASALRDSLVPIVGAENEHTLKTYRDESRAVKAFPFLAARARYLETALDCQRSLIGFHYDEKENSYKQQEAEISARVSADSTSQAERVVAAKEIIAALDRYRAIYAPTLEKATSAVDQAFARCGPFVPLFSKENHPEVARWYELTQQLIAARKAAVANVMHSIEWDRVLPEAVMGGAFKTMIVDGKSTLVLDEKTTARVKEFAEGAASLIEQSATVEQQLAEERAQLVGHLIGEDPQVATPPTDSPRAKPKVHRHPLENRAWFRLAKISWWSAAAIALILSILVADTFASFTIFVLVFGGVLFAVRTAVLYVVVGRPTLYERAGSGFVDLDMLEQELSTSPDGWQPPEAFLELKRRYGRRAPADVVKALIDRELARTRNEKHRVLAAADREGKAIRIDELRKNMRESFAHLPEPEQDAATNAMELLLLRLEVKHGRDIPLLVANEELDRLEAV